MHPEKKLLLIVLAQPVQCHVSHYVAWSFHLINVGLLQSAEIKMVIVKTKAMVQAEAGVQHRGRDHCSGDIALFLENRSQRWLRRIERVCGKIMHPTVGGISSGEDCRM